MRPRITRRVRSITRYFKKVYNKTKKGDAYMIVDLFSSAVLAVVRTAVIANPQSGLGPYAHTAMLIDVLGGRDESKTIMGVSNFI